MKCQACRQQEAMWAWQPFGPDEDIRKAFVLPGSHARSFPVVKVCDTCKDTVQANRQLSFRYQKVLFTYMDGVVASCTSQSGSNVPVRRADLIGHSLEHDTSIVTLDRDGKLFLTHVQAWLKDGRCIVFNGQIPLSLKDFKWVER